jgi:hypothetical protein
LQIEYFPTNEKFSRIPLVDPWQPRMVEEQTADPPKCLITNLLSSLLVSATYLFSSNLPGIRRDGFQYIIDGTSRRKGKLLFLVDFWVKMCGSRVT